MISNFLKREGFDYISNFYRYKLYDKETRHYLITTDDSNSLFLNSSSFRQLKKGVISSENLYTILEEKGVIVTTNNFNNIVQGFKKRYSFIASGTSLHIVVPTHRCNMGCIYCFANSPEIDNKTIADMTDETAIEVVEFIMKSPSELITIEFQGGEPLVAFNKIKLMVNHAKKLNNVYKKDLHLTVVSNFTLMTEEIANWFIDNNVSLCTSLDGPKELHNKNRPILAKNQIEIGTHDKVAYWIKKINSIYAKKGINENINALMTITKNSLPYYKEIIDEYVKFGIYMVDIRSLTKIGRAEENGDDIYYSDEEFLDFYKKSLAYIDTLRSAGIFVEDRIRELYYTKVLERKPGFHTDYESPCGAVTGNITYYVDGNIYICNEALGKEEFKVGSIKENWQDIFNKKETAQTILNSLLENNVMCDRCVYKPFCGTCQVENLENLGKFNFYPTKTARCHQTKFHAKNIYDKILNQLKKDM